MTACFCFRKMSWRDVHVHRNLAIAATHTLYTAYGQSNFKALKWNRPNSGAISLQRALSGLYATGTGWDLPISESIFPLNTLLSLTRRNIHKPVHLPFVTIRIICHKVKDEFKCWVFVNSLDLFKWQRSLKKISRNTLHFIKPKI